MAIDKVNDTVAMVARVATRQMGNVVYVDMLVLFHTAEGRVCHVYFENGKVSKFGRQKIMLEVLRRAGIVH